MLQKNHRHASHAAAGYRGGQGRARRGGVGKGSPAARLSRLPCAVCAACSKRLTDPVGAAMPLRAVGLQGAAEPGAAAPCGAVRRDGLRRQANAGCVLVAASLSDWAGCRRAKRPVLRHRRGAQVTSREHINRYARRVRRAVQKSKGLLGNGCDKLGWEACTFKQGCSQETKAK